MATVNDQTDLKDQHDIICLAAEEFGMEEITYLYHVTEPENSLRIRADNTIKARNAGIGYKIKGVWLCGSLYDGGLPTISPYGTHRFLFPVNDLLSDPNLNLYFVDCQKFVGSGCQYVRLLVTTRSCDDDHFVRMDMSNNPLFQMSPTGAYVCKAYNPTISPKMYVEILFESDIELQEGHFSSQPNPEYWDFVSPVVRSFDTSGAIGILGSIKRLARDAKLDAQLRNLTVQ